MNSVRQNNVKLTVKIIVARLLPIILVSIGTGLLASCAGAEQSQLRNEGTQMNQNKSDISESMYDLRDRAVSLIESMALEMNVANEQFTDFKEAESKNMRPIKCFENKLLWRTQVIIHSPVELERNLITDQMMNIAIKKRGGVLNYVEKNVLSDGTTEWRYDIGFPDGFASLILIRAVGVSFRVATPCGVF